MFIRLIASIRDPFFIFFHPFEQRLPRGRRRVGFYRSKDIVEQSMILSHFSFQFYACTEPDERKNSCHYEINIDR